MSSSSGVRQVQMAWVAEKTQKIVCRSGSLEAVCYGPSPLQAPTLVLLHEGLGSSELWRDFPRLLADKSQWGVLVFSRAGYGGSSSTPLPRPLDYMRREAVDTLPEVLKEAGIRKFVLLGHSDGASIAATYAGSVADGRLRGMVLLAPHFFTEYQGLEAIRRAREKFHHGDLRARLSRYHHDVDNAFIGWSDAWLNPDFQSWDITSEIDHWRVPVLAIQGIDDPYGSEAQLEVAQLRSSAPVELKILQDCQHAPHLERSETTLNTIVEFLTRLKRSEQLCGCAGISPAAN